MTTYFTYLESPLGRICIEGDEEFVTGLYFPHHKWWRGLDDSWRESDEPFHRVREQLAEYFAGERQTFDVPVKLAGTPFQQRVWEQLAQIPFGSTISYGELARRVGNLSASRAVGSANGRNPVSIIVPCHRVIGASGKLTGYGGGIDRKQWLLDWERDVAIGKNLNRFLAPATAAGNSQFVAASSTIDG